MDNKKQLIKKEIINKFIKQKSERNQIQKEVDIEVQFNEIYESFNETFFTEYKK